MSQSRPFAYNTGPTIAGTQQLGSLAIGIPTSGFGSTGLEWWNGPDEDLGYVIAQSVPDDSQPTPVSGVSASVGFFRSTDLTDQSFIDLADTIAGPSGPFASASDAKTWLNNNGYWTSYSSIITDNLLVFLDSGDSSSYPGTGNTWYDLQGAANNATLINSPTYSASFGGILGFDDASSEYATIPNIGNQTHWTVECWFRLATSLTGKVTAIVANQFDLISKLNFSVGTNRAPVSYNLCVGFYNGAWRTTSGFDPSINTWYQVVGTYDGTTIRQYVNGVANGGTLTYSGTPQSGGEVRLMRRWDETLSSGNLTDGDLAIVRIYSDALTSAEVLQNFESDRSRFGI
jgi:hypothetical protein